MDRAQFVESLRQAIEWQGELTADTPLSGSDQWDSLGVMSATMYLKNEFGVIPPADDVRDAASVKDLIAFVADQLD